VNGLVINLAMHPKDFLNDGQGALVDPAGNLGIQRFAVEGVPQYGLTIGYFQGVATDRFPFAAHTLIFAFADSRSMPTPRMVLVAIPGRITEKQPGMSPTASQEFCSERSAADLYDAPLVSAENSAENGTGY
jgi:hypothetical protein